MARHAQDVGKIAANKNLSVRLHAVAKTLAYRPLILRLSVWSSLPSVSNRAMRLRVTAAPPLGVTVKKSPPLKSCRPPAPRLRNTFDRLDAFGLNESANPVVAIEPGDVVAHLSADAGKIAAR